MQTKTQSAIESVTNVATGMAISYALGMIVYPCSDSRSRRRRMAGSLRYSPPYRSPAAISGAASSINYRHISHEETEKMKILYHANCLDGSGAALTAWIQLLDAGNEYIPVQYGSEPPDTDDADVLILDFSYQRDQLIEMSRTAKSITLIDHHKTAEQELSGIEPDLHCPATIIFDMEKSGCVLTWDYFHKTQAPMLLRHIQDKDLWQFRLPGTKDVCAGLMVRPDWKEWKRAIDDKANLADIEDDGRPINTFIEIQAEKIIKTKPTIWDITGDRVPVYNLPGFMTSETLDMALEKYQKCPYAVGYFKIGEKWIYSLRSRNGSDIDVSEIARLHGGGGHKHAAGFYI
jgi:uncharacterized protein